MNAFSHGGDICTYGQVLDFSANLNPLGMPPEVEAAARAAVSQAVHYPDPFCRAVRQALSGRDGVPMEYITCGNGAADIIFRLCLALRPRRAVICAPTFSEYEQALGITGCEIKVHTLLRERGFELQEDFLGEIDQNTDIVFLCTPNNPTGRLIAPSLLERIAQKCRESGTVLVLDECFLELSDETSGFARLLEENDKLVLLRAFTKSFAMPGLRFGYALCSNGKLLSDINSCAQPWSVSTVAQEAARAACYLPDWALQGRELISFERPRLIEALRELGLEVWEGQANYLLFRAEGVADLREKMVKKGILIRSCANYRALGGDYYRIAVRGGEDNSKCVAALREVLQNG